MIAYLVPEFPRLSESFVSREVAFVAESLPVKVISIGRADDADTEMMADLARRGVEPYYLLERFPMRLLALALTFAVRAPLAALRLQRLSSRFPRVQDCSRVGRGLKAMACAELVRRMHIRHLHSHWTLPTDVAWFCSEVTGVPFSFSAHAHDIYEDGELYARQGPEFGLGRRIAASTFVATCTDRGFRYLRDQPGAIASKVHLVYHGVDVGRVPKPLSNGTTPLRIVGAGRLVYYKGFDRLLRLCDRLRGEGVGFHCRIAGDGSQRRALETMIGELALEDHVELVGPKQHAEVLEMLIAADVFVFCGRPEAGQYGLPNVLFEAMACGAATVTTWLPEIAELVADGENGLVASDDEELWRCLWTVATDSDVRRRLIEQGRATVEAKFDGGVSMRPLLELLPGGGDRAGGRR